MGVPLETNERRIVFIHGKDRVLLVMPLDGYEPGDIKEAREKLAEENQCKLEEIEVRITGVKDRKEKKRPSKLTVIEGG